MGYLKTKEAIFKQLPELSEEDRRRVNSVFTPYLFISDDKRDERRECRCSSCGEHFFYEHRQRFEPPEHYEFMSAKHNEYVKCPKCGRTVKAKFTNRVKECKNPQEWKRAVFVKPKSKNEVYLICCYATKDYANQNFLTKPEISTATVYYLAPGIAREYKLRYDYTFLGINDNEFYETKRLTEPFTKTLLYNWSCIEKRGYSFIGFERLLDTFLRYVPVDGFAEPYKRWYYGRNAEYYIHNNVGEVPEVQLLAYSAVYPSVERLLKVGLSDFVCELLNGRPMKRNINWNAATPKEMFGMNKAQFADFREHYYGETDFKVFQSLKHCKNFTYTNAVEIVNKFAGESSVRMAQAVKRYGLNLTHTLNYLDKHTPKGKKKERNTFDFEHTAIMWTDYLHFASELKYDFSRTDSDVFFPKDLQLAHDNASANYVAAQDEKQFVKYQKRYEKLKKLYEYSNGKYKIVIPLGAKDIVEEGKVLCHCVGGYASRHMNGKTTIVFMRAADKPNKRLVTIEVNDSYKSICQNYGRKNRCVTKEEKAFIDEWIAWVQAGSKRNKKKPAETAA